ncbi:MAG: prephenate dehydrogenase, partial [Streptococcus alactolyticus]|nr:prephenate dehydrogenase [Streptococcus alactolyticus]
DLVTDLKDLAPISDIIIIAAPIKPTIDILKQLDDLDLKDQVIITDTGSTKSEIVAVGESVFANRSIRFVGGHPMAGSHKSGPLAADVTLFENAYYILTPSVLTSEGTIEEIQDLLTGLNARFIRIDADEHDRVTSQISHFPHILAASLMEQAGDYALEHEMTNQFAAGGFRDMTRISESDPSMWTSVLLSNKTAILERITDFQDRLDAVAELIVQSDDQAIWDYFYHARDTRQQMTIHKRGGVESSFDIFVDIPDKEDVILDILELLRGISLVNIHINEKNREDINGILQISFKNRKDLERAKQAISEHTDYNVYIN